MRYEKSFESSSWQGGSINAWYQLGILSYFLSQASYTNILGYLFFDNLLPRDLWSCISDTYVGKLQGTCSKKAGFLCVTCRGLYSRLSLVNLHVLRPHPRTLQPWVQALSSFLSLHRLVAIANLMVAETIS